MKNTLSRAPSAVARRTRRWWRNATIGDRPPMAEAALAWLLQSATDDGFSVDGVGPACRRLTAALLPTLRNFGETECVLRLKERGHSTFSKLSRMSPFIDLSPFIDRDDDDHYAEAATVDVARQAAVSFAFGERADGDRAMQWLRSRQRPDGSWSAVRHEGHEASGPASAWTAKFVLDASLAQVAAAFDAEPEGLNEPLTEDDGRWIATRALIDELAPTAEVVDVGCGGGRFLARLAEHRPTLRLTGVDPSPRQLRYVRHAEAAVGSVLQLPLDDDRYDAALCIEALEHSLIPRRAVAELCRVVRGGGRVLIIDKDARFQSLSLHEPWERWFTPESVCGWLSEHCDDVSCTPLGPGPHQRTPGLFLAWQGVRRESRGLAS